ncbi:hypothetical protein CKO_00596 [Citrobacter koseri ATCC BAA-895]|uniref:Uncharacterized protein n=1 Tax=Citrobacter koseri (strain ATCC BAA-895 / CDC 4225-83 / SGSC4696) TaxID=290338 RepID=A8AE37_CITK8|nr:hypothetical protein CKO_00596 [Citrobacter koseri ATCC BAA-895]
MILHKININGKNDGFDVDVRQQRKPSSFHVVY